MGKFSLRQALKEYEKIYMASRNFAKRTRVEYLNDLEDMIRLLELIGINEVQDIRLPHLERYLAELDRVGFAGSTRKRKVISIRSFFWYLYQDRYISTNLAKKLIPPFVEAKSPRYLTKSEYERLLRVCAHNSRDFALIQLLLQTGIKLSELTHLTIDDIEFIPELTPEAIDAGNLHIRRNKRKKGRILPLNYKVCLALDKYLKSRQSKRKSTLFINRFGKKLRQRGVEKIVSKYTKQAGIKNANVQSFRHTFAINQLNQSTSTTNLKKLMGYEDSRSLSKYISLSTRLTNNGLPNVADFANKPGTR